MLTLLPRHRLPLLTLHGLPLNYITPTPSTQLVSSHDACPSFRHSPSRVLTLGARRLDTCCVPCHEPLASHVPDHVRPIYYGGSKGGAGNLRGSGGLWGNGI